jgi:hypothetical protein
MLFPHRRRRDERGAVLVMTSLVASVLMVLGAFAVDLGMQRVSRLARLRRRLPVDDPGHGQADGRPGAGCLHGRLPPESDRRRWVDPAVGRRSQPGLGLLRCRLLRRTPGDQGLGAAQHDARQRAWYDCAWLQRSRGRQRLAPRDHSCVEGWLHQRRAGPIERQARRLRAGHRDCADQRTRRRDRGRRAPPVDLRPARLPEQGDRPGQASRRRHRKHFGSRRHVQRAQPDPRCGDRVGRQPPRGCAEPGDIAAERDQPDRPADHHRSASVRLRLRDRQDLADRPPRSTGTSI